MSNFILNDHLNNGYSPSILGIFILTAIISGIFVITVRNPIISVLFLISLFASISGYLIVLGLNFIGLSYLLVYIGAISILFIFILMLINIRISELHFNNNDNITLGFIISILFYYPFFISLPFSLANMGNNFSLLINWINYKIFYNNIFTNYVHIKDINTSISNKIYQFLLSNSTEFSTSNSWENSLIESTQISSLGNIVYSNFSIWLIITSMILLLSMVGAIIITIKPFNITSNLNIN